MAIIQHTDIIQGSDEWFAIRCGLMTASEMKLIITEKTLKPANNDKERSHLYELVAQRITKYVEPSYIGENMIRGQEDEVEARKLYEEKYCTPYQLQLAGFITNDKWGYTLGYSPDALVGEDGIIECKSRCQKYQIETIIGDAMPDDFKIQVQTALLVTERKWCDFVSYSGGLPMMTKRVYPDPETQKSILEASSLFHGKINKMLAAYDEQIKSATARLIPTKRRLPAQEMEITE